MDNKVVKISMAKLFAVDIFLCNICICFGLSALHKLFANIIYYTR